MKTQDSWLARERRWLYATGVLLLMLVMVFAAREYFLRSVTERWPTLQKEVNSAQALQVARSLDALCQDLHGAGASLLAAAFSGMGKDVGTRMAAQLREQEYSFELRDTAGTLIAYGGDPIFPQPEQPSLRPFSVHSRMPFLLLVANLRDDRRNVTLSVSTPIATSVPVSRRFLNSEGFLPELSRNLDLELLYSPEQPDVRPADIAVPFLAGEDTLGFVSFEGITLEARLDRISRQFGRVLLFLLLAAIVVASVPMFRLYHRWPGTVAAAAKVVHIWAARYVLLWAGFAEALFPDALLDPAYFASSFGGGLSASPGELTMSALALLFSVIAVHRIIAAAGQSEAPHRSSLFILLPIYGILPFTLRGFAAGIRSFVVDSTFNFDSIDGLLDEPMLLLMMGNSYLLALALGFGLIVMYLAVKRALGAVQAPAQRMIMLFGGVVWSLLVLLLTTGNLLLPLWAYAGYALLFSAPIVLRMPLLRGRSSSLFAPLLVAAVLGSVLTTGLYGRWMEAKRSSEIEAIAIDFARPVDGWSQVLMEQTLQYVSRAEIADVSRTPEGAATDYAAAFRIWAGSPLSRLQNNSAIFLTDSSGVPFSRFAAGNDPFLLSLHALSSTVARTEGIVQRSDRQLETRKRRYYQGYADIQTAGRKGLVAVVILEALDPMEMAGQGIDLLRNAPAKLSSAPEDRFIVSRFQGKRMVQTSDRNLERATTLPEAVRASLAVGQESFWHSLPVDGEDLQTYFMRLPEPGDDVLAITQGKPVALLTAYRALRIAVLFFFFSAMIWILAALFSGRFTHWARLTFARRLQLALLGVAAIPLLLIWITGRDFALETTLNEIERQVTEDLDVLRSNMLEQLPDSIAVENLTTYVDDQRCQEIRLRSGRDINIYRGTELTATSKPELYHVGLLNNRLHPVAWLNIVQRGRDAWFTTERIGDFSYQVGYRALRTPNGDLAAVISTPTLFQREQIDQGYTRASATIFLWILLIAVLVLFASAALARQISRPLSELLRATRDITAGNLDRRVQVSGSAEIVDLMDAFNTMTARLRRSQEELAAAERELAWKEMAKQVAHEIRNPLTPMKLAVQHLQRAWHDGASQIGDIVEKVTHTLIDQIESLSRISDEFSRFARMPRRSTAQVDAGATLREAVALFGSHEEVQFSLQIEDGLPSVMADREELARAFTNLLRNALQATHEPGTIAISASSNAEGIRILISDTGTGIPPELLSRIFEPNFSTKTEGMGLGLAIVKKIIDDAGGTIRIESTPGEGTTVIITLPAS